jgi:hypothetical protein
LHFILILQTNTIMNFPKYFKQVTTCTLAALFLMAVPSFAQNSNPAASGFNQAGSDPKAIAIADEVMAAMGGRKAWDKTRYLYWTFFGRRNLLWDKKKEMARIEMVGEETVYIVNLKDETGQFTFKGQAKSAPDSIKKYGHMAKSIWINDSYWLVMPYKLKDSGLTLKYKGEQNTTDGRAADVLEMTFAGVGRTPDNRYLVYVDKQTRLVSEWSYFPKASDEKPMFTNTWENYQQMGAIKLSDARGKRKLDNVKVLKTVPKEAFTSTAAIKL